MSFIQNSIAEFSLEQTGSPRSPLHEKVNEKENIQPILGFTDYSQNDLEFLKTRFDKIIKESKERIIKWNLETQLHNKFEEEYKNLHPYFESLSYGYLKDLFEENSSNFLKLSPKLMTVALTYDQSIRFTAIFDNERVYLEVFLDEEGPDYYMSIYKSKDEMDEVNSEEADTIFKRLANYFESVSKEEPIKVLNGKYGDLPEPFAPEGALPVY